MDLKKIKTGKYYRGNYKILKNQLKKCMSVIFCPGNVFLYNHMCDSPENKKLNKNKWGKKKVVGFC